MSVCMKAISGDEHVADVASPLFALVEFYKAFNSRDLELMKANWAQTGDVSMANPLGGVKLGWWALEGVYSRIFDGPAEVFVEFYDYVVQRSGSMFCVAGRERGRFRLGDQELALAIRTSRSYQFLGGRWQQIHHHGSIDDPDMLAAYQGALGLR